MRAALGSLGRGTLGFLGLWMGRFLLLGLIGAVCVASAFAQPAKDEPSIKFPQPANEEPLPPEFSAPMLDAPPREESGPLGKKPLPSRNAPDANEPDVGGAATFSPAGAATPPPPPADAARLKNYIDGLMAGLLAAGELPGAVVLVIQDGKVTLKQGYGFADIRARLPVDPDRTRFRVGSISKLFTATAVMQLVEQGKVDLNADVNTYLSQFKIPPTFAEPVTLANVMTHTAGFDDRYIGISTPLNGVVEPLGQTLAKAMPPRVLPPGRTLVYSNHGFALAGHIVESVSGQEFGAYVQENIFAPLGMTSSGFGVSQPVSQDIAIPYFKGGDEGGFKRAELDRLRLGPAGDLITTASDMAKFMLVHMSQGVYGDDEHLLSAITIERMHAQHFAAAEGLDGWAYGFAEGHRNGVRWIGHDGSWLGFCAQLVMTPETKTGFFVASNTDCRFSTNAPLRKALFDLIWPVRGEPVAEPNPTAEMRAQSLAGSYMAARRARSDFTVMAAASSQLTVKAPGEGRLLVQLPEAKREFVFLPQANGTWINPDLQIKAAALVDARGQATQLALDSEVFDRVAGANDWAIWSAMLSFVVLICLATAWGWTNGFLSRQLFGEPQAVITLWPRLVAFVAALLTLATLIGMAGVMSGDARLQVVHGPSPMTTALISAPVVVAMLAIPMVVWSMMGFGVGGRARTAQAGYAALTIAILVFLAFAWQWSLHPFGLLATD